MSRCAIVVMGASAGGLEPVLSTFERLGPEVPAAWFVVLHIDAHPSLMADLLGQRSRIPAREAVEGAPLESGMITVAKPDHHLLVGRHRVMLSHGPRENWARPAIDPLFRSAAQAHGPRVIGVILSGHLNDGSAGLRTIKAHGGTAVVQDPLDAACADMPRNALYHAAVDHCVPAWQLPSLLTELATGTFHHYPAAEPVELHEAHRA